MSQHDRYSRQTLIDGWDQEKLNCKCIIVGTGALGCVVGVNLAQAGVKKLLLIDMDTIEFSNLNRQLLFVEDDVGKFKAEVAREKLTKINSDIKIEAYAKKIQDLPSLLFKPDTPKQKVIIIDALDNFESRRWINALAVSNNIPFVSGGMYGFLGNVQVIIPFELPCLECQPLIPEKELQKACTPPGDIRKADEEKIDIIEQTEEFFPALGPVSSIIGGVMSQEVIKIAMEMDYLKDYFFVDLKNNNFIKIPLNIKKDCIVCSEKFKLNGIPISFDTGENISELKKRLSIQFNIEGTELELIHNLKTVSDDNLLIKSLFTDSKNVILYISSSQMSTPVKIALEISKSKKKKTKKKKSKKKSSKSRKKTKKTVKKKPVKKTKKRKAKKKSKKK